MRAAEHTNVTLTSLEELKQTAKTDLVLSALHTLEMRAIRVRSGLHELFRTERKGPGLITSQLLPGVNGHAVMHAIGTLSVLQFDFERARIGKSPSPIEFDDSGNNQIVVGTMEEFVTRAALVIASAEATVQGNEPKR